MRIVFKILLLLLGPAIACGDFINQVGSYEGWNTISWQPILSLNDPDDGVAEQLEFVGDSSDPAAYWAINDDLLFFRMRLDVAAVGKNTFQDAHIILIDVQGYGADGLPDYSLTWDSKLKKGLELGQLSEGMPGDAWNDIRMIGIDDDQIPDGIQAAPTVGQTSNGFLRSVDSQPTANFGNTTFLDFGVSLSYLESHAPGLLSGGEWQIQFVSQDNPSSKNSTTREVAAGGNPFDTITSGSWSEAVAIPEPATISLIFLFGGGMLATNRILRLYAGQTATHG